MSKFRAQIDPANKVAPDKAHLLPPPTYSSFSIVTDPSEIDGKEEVNIEAEQTDAEEAEKIAKETAALFDDEDEDLADEIIADLNQGGAALDAEGESFNQELPMSIYSWSDSQKIVMGNVEWHLHWRMPWLH